MKINTFILVLSLFISGSAFAYGLYLPGSCEKESLASGTTRCNCKVVDEKSYVPTILTINVGCDTVQCEQWAPQYELTCLPLATCNMVNVERDSGQERKVLCPVSIRLAPDTTQDAECKRIESELNTHRSIANYCQVSREFMTPWFYDRDNSSGATPLPGVGSH